MTHHIQWNVTRLRTLTHHIQWNVARLRTLTHHILRDVARLRTLTHHIQWNVARLRTLTHHILRDVARLRTLTHHIQRNVDCLRTLTHHIQRNVACLRTSTHYFGFRKASPHHKSSIFHVIEHYPARRDACYDWRNSRSDKKEGARQDCRHLGIVSLYPEQKEGEKLAGMKKQLYLCSVKNDSLVSLS